MWHSSPVVFASKSRDVMMLGGAHSDEYFAFANEIEKEFGNKFNCTYYGTGPGFCQADGECA